jgi:hypothetical protein
VPVHSVAARKLKKFSLAKTHDRTGALGRRFCLYAVNSRSLSGTTLSPFYQPMTEIVRRHCAKDRIELPTSLL